jgi:hypothetical protein
MFSKSVVAAVLGVLLTAGYSLAQPGHPQGTTRIGGGGGGYSSGGYSGGYSAPANVDAGAAQQGYQSMFAEPERNGWQTRSDGWYYYWSRNQLVGAYDPDNEQWYAYNNGWGKASRAPWKSSK